MRRHDRSSIGIDRELAHQRAELADLFALDLVAEKDVGNRVDHDGARPQRDRFGVEVSEQCRRPDASAAIELGKHRVFTGICKEFETAGDQIGKAGSVIVEDDCEPAPNFVLLVLGAEIDGRPGPRTQTSDP